MNKIAMLVATVVIFSFLFLFCNIGMAFPPLPSDLNVVPPDSSLPKELAAFSGKWEGKSGSREFYLVVEKIDQEKAIFLLSSGSGWERVTANVVKERGKYKIWFTGRYGQNELSLRGKKLDYLDLYVPQGTVTLTRVP